jgi:DNA (cytosine-5)-methyltransferase 1
MRHLDLFTGVGGFACAAQMVWGKDYKPVAFCEIDKFCQKVLKKHWPDVEIIDDVKSERIKQFRDIDLLTAGVPCQPASVAGKKRGTVDERWLWPETLDCIRNIRPRFALLENVPGLFTIESGLAFNAILSKLAEIGYDCWWETISASAVGAPHKRDRIWITAWDGNYKPMQKNGQIPKRENANADRGNGYACNAQCVGLQGQPRRRAGTFIKDGYIQPEQTNAHTESDRLQGWRLARARQENIIAGADELTADTDGKYGEEHQRRGKLRQAGRKGTFRWSIYEPTWQENWIEVATRLCVLDDGLSNGLVRPKGWRVNALKAGGNSIVPQVAMTIMKAIKKIDN